MTTDVKYLLNDEAVCPYCDYEESDSWEITGDDGDKVQVECGNCSKTYLFQRVVSVAYTTYKADCANDLTEHQWKNHVSAPREYAIGKQGCEVCFSERVIDTAEWEKIEADLNHPQNWRSQ